MIGDIQLYSLKKFSFVAVGFILIGISMLSACYFSTVKVNRSKYQVFGVDVSHYQGDIDWKKLESQGVMFAFIKATEGSGHVDESSRYNLLICTEYQY